MKENLKDFLRQMGMEDLHSIFVEHDIDTSLLFDLTDHDLREMGLSIGQRKRLLRAIAIGTRPAKGAHTEDVFAPERRQLTMLFADIVGSTKIASAVDPEELRDIFSAYHEACLAVMRANGGYVAYHQGDGVGVYFGYPVGREDNAERAIRASLELIGAIGKLETASPTPLQIRIGVATGIVIVGELAADGALHQEMVHGQTPHLAARIQNFAAPDEIVVSDTTRRLAGAGFEYEFLGAHELKGFSEPQKLFRVVGESRVESRFEARTGGPLQPLVGRDAEMSTLSKIWRETVPSGGRVALLRGQPGIGKSRLLREFSQLLDRSEHLMLNFFCAPHLTNRALHPFTREIARTIGIVPEEPPATSLDRLISMISMNPELSDHDLPVFADLLGIETKKSLQLDAQAKARRTFDALARRIIGLARSQPLLMAFEDAQWADSTTVEFLQLLVERIADVACLLLVTCRPEFEQKLAVPENGVLLDLDRLDVEAGADLVAHIAGENQLTETLSKRIIEKADGVPLFVQELTRGVLDSVVARELPGSPLTLESISIPATLYDSLMGRLDRIEGGKEIVQLAAVIGREFTADMLRAIAARDVDIDARLEQLCDAEMVYQGETGGSGWFVFHHALVQDAAYESMLKKRRSEVHRMIATAILDGNPAFKAPEPEILARHCAYGELHEPAAEKWLEAGMHAIDRAASSAAVIHLRNCLEQTALLADSEQRARRELLAQQALAAASMSVYGWASDEVNNACAEAHQLALLLGDNESLYGAKWGLWSTQFIRGNQKLALEQAQELNEMAEASGVPFLLTTADHAVGYTHFWRGEHSEALKRAGRAIARYDAKTERIIIRMFQLASTVTAHIFGAASLWLQGNSIEADRGLKSAIELAESLEHPPTLGYTLGAVGQTLVMWREWKRLGDTANRLLRLADEEGLLMWRTMGEMHSAIARGHLGQPEKGLADFEIARERFLATRSRIVDPMHQASVSGLMIQVGIPEAAVARLDTTIGEAEVRGERVYLSELYRMRGEAHRSLGERDSAGADFAAALRIATEQKAVPLIHLAKQSVDQAGQVDPQARRNTVRL